MPLKKVNTGKPTTAKKAIATVETPTVKLTSSIVHIYNEARRKLKEAEEAMASVEADLKRAGASAVFKVNSSFNSPALKSVILKDLTGSSIRVTLANQYPALTESAATGLFEALDVDVNDYVVQTVKASFDSKVFLNANGDFRQDVFKTFSTACKQAALIVGVENPLTTTIVNTLKPDFDERRYADFTPEAQVLIYETAPNKTSLTPL